MYCLDDIVSTADGVDAYHLVKTGGRYKFVRFLLSLVLCVYSLASFSSSLSLFSRAHEEFL